MQLNEELHKRLKHAAIDEGITLHDWIIKVLEEKVGTERINANKLVKRKNDSGR